MPFGEGDVAFHDPFELSAIRQPGEVVCASLVRELARAIERDRDLVRDSSHEQQVRGTEDPRYVGAYAHDTDHPAPDTQLRT